MWITKYYLINNKFFLQNWEIIMQVVENLSKLIIKKYLGIFFNIFSNNLSC